MIIYKVRFSVGKIIVEQRIQAETYSWDINVPDKVEFFVQGVSVGYFVGFVDVLEMPSWPLKQP